MLIIFWGLVHRASPAWGFLSLNHFYWFLLSLNFTQNFWIEGAMRWWSGLRVSTLILLRLYGLNEKNCKVSKNEIFFCYSQFTEIEKSSIYNWEYYYVDGMPRKTWWISWKKGALSPGHYQKLLCSFLAQAFRIQLSNAVCLLPEDICMLTNADLSELHNIYIDPWGQRFCPCVDQCTQHLGPC